jgi:hypothetical protein
VPRHGANVVPEVRVASKPGRGSTGKFYPMH